MKSKILIITDHPGPEIFYLGGLLSHLKNRFGDIPNKEKPRILYGAISDDSYNQTIREIKEISNLLGFTWGVLYTGNKYFKQLYKFSELQNKLNRRIDFYKPDCICCLTPGTDVFNDKFILWNAIKNIRKNRYMSLIEFGNFFANFFFELSPSDISSKRKALTLYRSVIKDEVFLINKFIEQTKFCGSNINENYAECFRIIKSDNSLFRFLE